MYVRESITAPVLLPVGASQAATNAAAAKQTGAVPSATADAMIFSTPEVSRNPVAGGGIFTIADQLSSPGAAVALVGPTVDAGINIAEKSVTGAAQQVAANPLIAWGIFGLLSYAFFRKR